MNIHSLFFREIFLDKSILKWYSHFSFIKQTVDAEITAMMPPQRACDAGSQARNKLSNGPLRAQSNVVCHRVFCDVWAYVSCRGYDSILPSAQHLLLHCCESKVAPRMM